MGRVCLNFDAISYDSSKNIYPKSFSYTPVECNDGYFVTVCGLNIHTSTLDIAFGLDNNSCYLKVDNLCDVISRSWFHSGDIPDWVDTKYLLQLLTMMDGDKQSVDDFTKSVNKMYYNYRINTSSIILQYSNMVDMSLHSDSILGLGDESLFSSLLRELVIILKNNLDVSFSLFSKSSLEYVQLTDRLSSIGSDGLLNSSDYRYLVGLYGSKYGLPIDFLEGCLSYIPYLGKMLNDCRVSIRSTSSTPFRLCTLIEHVFFNKSSVTECEKVCYGMSDILIHKYGVIYIDYLLDNYSLLLKFYDRSKVIDMLIRYSIPVDTFTSILCNYVHFVVSKERTDRKIIEVSSDLVRCTNCF